jgi:hypothetical protein
MKEVKMYGTTKKISKILGGYRYFSEVRPDDI